jgi:hypothetical protein
MSAFDVDEDELMNGLEACVFDPSKKRRVDVEVMKKRFEAEEPPTENENDGYQSSAELRRKASTHRAQAPTLSLQFDAEVYDEVLRDVSRWLEGERTCELKKWAEAVTSGHVFLDDKIELRATEACNKYLTCGQDVANSHATVVNLRSRRQEEFDVLSSMREVHPLYTRAHCELMMKDKKEVQKLKKQFEVAKSLEVKLMTFKLKSQPRGNNR